MLTRRLKAAALLLAPLALVACTESTGPSDGTARLSILLTDAPGDVLSAVVTISDVYLQGGGDGEDGGRTHLLEGGPITTDLLSLANTARELVRDEEIREGNYGQLRFVLDGAYIEVEGEGGESLFYATSPDYEGLPDGVEPDGELMCPSCSQTGIKVLLGPLNGGGEDEEGELDVDGNKTLLIDFDVAESFGHQAGQSGRWVMHPTLKASWLEVELSELAVNVSADTSVTFPVVEGDTIGLGDFQVVLAPASGGTPTLASLTDTDGDGIWTADFGLLLPAAYEVGLLDIEGVTFDTDVELPVEVTVAEGTSSTVDIVLTEVAAAETP